MEIESDDLNHALMLDGNAVAGRLQELFGTEMTTNQTICATCDGAAEMGALLAFTHAPGIVLRCRSCGAVMLRVVETPRGIYLDARGTAVVRFGRP